MVAWLMPESAIWLHRRNLCRNSASDMVQFQMKPAEFWMRITASHPKPWVSDIVVQRQSRCGLIWIFFPSQGLQNGPKTLVKKSQLQAPSTNRRNTRPAGYRWPRRLGIQEGVGAKSGDVRWQRIFHWIWHWLITITKIEVNWDRFTRPIGSASQPKRMGETGQNLKTQNSNPKTVWYPQTILEHSLSGTVSTAKLNSTLMVYK